jgi:hypothetical protein
MRSFIIKCAIITAKWLAWFSIMGMGFMVLTVAYWSLKNYNVIEVQQPAQILNKDKIVRRGEIVSYKMIYQKHVNITARVRRQLENDRSICLMEGAGQAKMGMNNTTIDVFVPLNIFPGRYRLHTFYEYEVNPIRTIKYDYYTEWFEVLP